MLARDHSTTKKGTLNKIGDGLIQRSAFMLARDHPATKKGTVNNIVDGLMCQDKYKQSLSSKKSRQKPWD